MPRPTDTICAIATAAGLLVGLLAANTRRFAGSVLMRFTDLGLAILRDAVIVGANLQNANLYGANLRSAKLYEANLQDANLENADTSYAIYDENTIWPEGFDPQAGGAELGS